jgi:hypothetical protein
MKMPILAAVLAALTLQAGPAFADPPPWSHAGGRHGDHDRGDRGDRWDRGDRDRRHGHWDRGDRGDRRWRPEDHYRYGRGYRERRLGYGDNIYRGYDGRYYCRRTDGTTGLILGALGGGLLGNTIAPGGSKALGTILGGAGGALLGQSIDRNNIRCR